MKIIVERLWKNAEVTAYCTDEKVGVEIDLIVFLSVLVEKAKLPPEQIYAIDKVLPELLDQMKALTAKVV